MISENVQVALIVATPTFFIGVVLPVVMYILKTRADRLELEAAAKIRRAERLEDQRQAAEVASRLAIEAKSLMKRSTEAAVKAEEAAGLLVQSQDRVAERAEETAALLAKNTAAAAEAAKNLAAKVDRVEEVGKIVHTLVNSNLTVTTQKLRDKTLLALEVMRRHEPDRVSDIRVLETELRDLDAELSDRAVQQNKVEKRVGPAPVPTATDDDPLPVADDRTALASERVAAATERIADKAEKKP